MNTLSHINVQSLLFIYIFLLGNFKESCKLYFKHNSDFQNQYEKFINYTNATTQNTIIEICSNYVLDYIINEVKSADFYSIMCDEV